MHVDMHYHRPTFQAKKLRFCSWMAVLQEAKPDLSHRSLNMSPGPDVTRTGMCLGTEQARGYRENRCAVDSAFLWLGCGV